MNGGGAGVPPRGAGVPPAAEALVATVAATAIAALLAWPVPIDPNGHVVGASYNDHTSIAWTLDFVARRLASGELPWGHTTRIQHPDGATLFPADPLESILVAPVTLLFGAFAALNLLSVLHHGLAAGLGFGWLRSEGATRTGALTGAIALGLWPAMAAATFDGNPDVTPWFWAPAALWARWRPVRAGLLVAAAAASNPYAGVIAFGALFARLAVDRRWRDLAVSSSIGAAGLVGVAALTNAALHAGDAAILKGPRIGGLGTASLVGLVWPAPYVIPTDPGWDAPKVASSGYLGVSLLALASLGRRRAFGWGLVAVALVMALGPELRLVDGSDTGIPLPWAVAERLPGFDRLHHTARFTGLAAIGLAWLAAQGAERFRWAPILVFADLGLAAGGLSMLRGAPVWDDGSCALLADLPDGAVADLPPTFHEVGLLGQLCHGRPVAEGINSPVRRVPTTEPAWRWAVWHRELPGPAWQDELPARCEVARTERVSVFDLDCARQHSAN